MKRRTALQWIPAGLTLGAGPALADGSDAGSRHSLAIRADRSLWAWGDGFEIKPRRLLDGVLAVAAGDTATIARTAEGLWQWERGRGPQKVLLAR